MRNILVISVMCLLTSCVIEKEQIGNYKNLQGKSIVYEKGKDIYLFWDKVSVHKLENSIEIVDYEKIVKKNIFDNVVYYGTMGIFSFYTVVIKTKESKKESIISSGNRKHKH